MRVRALGLLGLWGVWSCGGTVERGDPESTGTDTSNSMGGSGGSSSGSSDGDGDSGDSGAAATTRGGGSRNNTASSTSSGSRDDSSAAVSSSSGGGTGGGAGGQGAASSSDVTTAGGLGGEPSDSAATVSSTSAVTSTTGGGGAVSSDPPNLEDFPHLEGCDVGYWFGSGDQCRLDFACPSESGGTACWDRGDVTLCDCNTQSYFSASYWLETTNVEEGCAYAASACLTGSEFEVGSRTCMPESLYHTESYCTARGLCQYDIDIEGVDISRLTSHQADCERDDAWICHWNLESGEMTVLLELSAVPAEICADALTLSTLEVTPEGPRECAAQEVFIYGDTCFVNIDCTQAALAGDVPGTITEHPGLVCSLDDTGAWVCDCLEAGTFNVEAETSLEACTLATAECLPQ